MIIKNVPNNLALKRLDKAAAEMFTDYSRTQIKKWIEDGKVLVNGEISQQRKKVNENDEIGSIKSFALSFNNLSSTTLTS